MTCLPVFLPAFSLRFGSILNGAPPAPYKKVDIEISIFDFFVLHISFLDIIPQNGGEWYRIVKEFFGDFYFSISAFLVEFDKA